MGSRAGLDRCGKSYPPPGFDRWTVQPGPSSGYCHQLKYVLTSFFFFFLYFQETGQQQNLLLGEYDVCISNVDVVYQLVGDKKRRLVPGSNVSGKVNGLHILCKVIIFS